MQPIETTYNGYKFRSRLEARWAVFLESIGASGASYAYEHEGYDLNGIWYLPDFWVPSWNSFIEIKPEEPRPEEEQKCELLSKLSGKKVILLCGNPWPGEYFAMHFPMHPEEELRGELWQCEQCKIVHFSAIDCNGNMWAMWPLWPKGCSHCGNTDSVSVTDELMAAFTTARQVRFDGK